MESIHQLTRICDMPDFSLDSKKTFCWANTAKGRRNFKEMSSPQHLAIRDLGGHVNYSRKHTNFTLQDKIALISVCARMFATIAWPDGVSINTLGTIHFDSCAHWASPNEQPTR